MAFGGGTAFVIQGVVNILTNAAEQQLKDLEKQGANTSKGLTSGFDNAAASVMKFAGPAVLGALSAVLVKVTSDAVSFGLAVDTAMKQFQASTGASRAEAEAFAQSIANIADVNGETAQELAAAMTQVSRLFNATGQELEDLTQKFIDFTDVSGQDAATSTQTVTQVLRAWGLEAKDVGQLTDVLGKAIQETGVDAGTLTNALSSGAAVIQSMGFSVEEAAALFGSFSKQGVDATAALTGLRNTLTAAQGPTEKQVSAFKTLGEIGRAHV